MKQPDTKRDFNETPLYYGGIGAIILGITYGVVTIITSFVHSVDNNNDEKAKIEIARVQACGDIKDDGLRTICINGEDK